MWKQKNHIVLGRKQSGKKKRKLLDEQNNVQLPNPTLANAKIV